MKYRFLYITILIPFILMGCRKDYVFKMFDYSTYNRVVGPKGGTINYYANYNNDSSTAIVASLDVPIGALDSLMVFNMYQFEDYELATLMEDGFAKMGSKLIYFIPFYESDGYHERGQMELNYHLSANFKKPVNVTYHPLAEYSDLVLKNWQEVELYNNFYKSANGSYKVYKIKIPRIDEWGENNNIFVNWNRQGYANGYDATDISYIVNGRWTASDSWGTGETSMTNWELVGTYTINSADDVISFTITDTDHFYIVARDIYLRIIPSNLNTTITTTPRLAGLQIKRASFDYQNYQVYFTDNSTAVFSRYFSFLYIEKKNLASSDYPNSSILSYLKNNSIPGNINGVTSRDDGISTQYDVYMSTGLKLTFGGTGAYLGMYQYGFDPNNLPGQANNYLRSKYPNDQITNVSLNTVNGVEYIVYLSSNIKVYFDSDGMMTKTLHYRMNSNQLPANILSYFSTNYPNAIYNEINLTELAQGVPYFDISLADNKKFKFTIDGTLTWYEFQNLSVNDLPSAIRTNLDQNYSLYTISNIWHTYTINTEYYDIFFTDNNIKYIRLYSRGG
jgi:hypothetical protein